MSDSLPIPSEDLMWNVAMTRDAEEFFRVGQRCAKEIMEAADNAGIPFNSAARILDWGCGSGRTLRWLISGAKDGQFSGCDVDEAAVKWCQANLKGVNFETTGAHPPLPYNDGEFDIVYGISVFTHLNEEFQERWLKELHRIVRANGIVMLSVMGEPIAMHLPDPSKSEFLEKGFLFKSSPVWEGIHSEWYADAFQSEAQVRDSFSRYFEVVSYNQSGMNGHQDLVVLRRPS